MRVLTRGSGASAVGGAAVGVGIINVGATIVALWVLDRIGRRPPLMIGTIVMGLALGTLAVVFATGAEGTAGSVVAVGALMLYVAAFAMSLGPIFWLLNAEIYPLKVRSKAAAGSVPSSSRLAWRTAVKSASAGSIGRSAYRSSIAQASSS